MEAEWSINDAGLAELSKDEAAKTRVTAIAITEGTKIVAIRGEQTARADLVIKSGACPRATTRGAAAAR